MSYLKWRIQGIKFRKLKTLDGYIDYIKNQDYSKSDALSIGDTTALEEPDYNNMFIYLDEYDEIKKKYSLDSVIKGNTDFERALSLMQWLTDNTYYNGSQCLFYKLLCDDTLEILDFSYKKGFTGAINCRYKAIVLADLLIAYGIQAYPIVMLDAKKDGNHLTVQVYLSDEKKWVLLDPSFNTYFTDSDNDVLDVLKLRDCFLAGKEPIIVGYNFNGTAEGMDVYKEMFIKPCLTNLRTWKDNSLSGRKTKRIKDRKAFECKLPSQQ